MGVHVYKARDYRLAAAVHYLCTGWRLQRRADTAYSACIVNEDTGAGVAVENVSEEDHRVWNGFEKTGRACRFKLELFF